MTPGEVRGALLILCVFISSMIVGVWLGRLQPLFPLTSPLGAYLPPSLSLRLTRVSVVAAL